MTNIVQNIDQLVDEVMEDPMTVDAHRVAANAFEASRCLTLDQSSRRVYAAVEAEWLLKAVSTTHRRLTAVQQLQIAARLAERIHA